MRTTSFSAWYLYVRLGDGKIMAEFLDQYEDWLRSQGLDHQPELFATGPSEPTLREAQPRNVALRSASAVPCNPAKSGTEDIASGGPAARAA